MQHACAAAQLDPIKSPLMNPEVYLFPSVIVFHLCSSAIYATFDLFFSRSQIIKPELVGRHHSPAPSEAAELKDLRLPGFVGEVLAG